MKKLLFLILALIPSLAACSAQTQGASVSVLPSVMTSLSASPLPSDTPTADKTELPTDTPMPLPSFAVMDTNIPDVIKYPGEVSICSSNPLEEDDNYYYFSPSFSYSEGISHKSIYCISKSNGSIKQVTDNFEVFTVANGVIYYTGEFPHNNLLYSYDTASGETRKIKDFGYHIFQLSYYDGRFYYLLDHSDNENSSDFLCGLYSCNKDWSDIMKINDPVSTEMFYIYKDRIYYQISPTDSSSYIASCSLNGKDARQASKAFNFWYEINVNNGKLFYHDHLGQDWTFNIEDIKTRKVTKLPDFDNCALLGQYIFFPDNNDFLSAYDIKSGKQYKLFETDDYYPDTTYTTPRGAYVSLGNDDSLFVLYKLVISGGKASLEKVAEFPPVK